MAILKVISEAEYGRVFPVSEPSCLVARNEASPIFELFRDSKHRVVSRDHAEISKIDDDFVIRDLNSKKGTWLNGKRITAEERLRDGDVLSIGDLEFKFYESEPVR